MDMIFYEGQPSEAECDILLAGKFEGEKLDEQTLAIDSVMAGSLTKIIEEDEFNGKDESCLLVHTLGKIKARIIAIAGLGKKNEFNIDKARKAIASAVIKAADVSASKFAALPFETAGLNSRDILQAMAEGISLAAYRFDKYLEKKENDKKKKIVTVLFIAKRTDESALSIERGRLISEGVNFARNIVNEPANVVTPVSLAETAMKLSENQGITWRVYEESGIKDMGMGAVLAVASGSANQPRFIHLTYTPPGKPSSKIALVGKGLTFDSGGLNLKPGEHMQHMKMDKSGACAVLGIMSVLSRLNSDKEIHGIIAAVENMPGGKAMRPDDILKTMNGKTIEVLNTDAEGRLTLADALSYAANLKPDRIIDLATLTGACVVALGEYTTGIMGNNQEFIDEILDSSRAAGEHMWQLPFYEPMREKIKSDVADLKNIGDRYGGAITAGLFLDPFVDSIPWVHMDIAGPAFTEKGWGYNPKGATGAGVRTVLKYLLS